MISGDGWGLSFPDIYLTVGEKPRKNLNQENLPDRGSNPDPLRDRHACCRLAHSGGHKCIVFIMICLDDYNEKCYYV